MLRKLTFLFALVMMLAAAGSVSAFQDWGPRDSDPDWQATYWNNMSLSGQPALTGSYSGINFDWGTGSPDAAIQSDHFSARWQRYFDLQAGAYRFTATTDDGVRVYVDNRLVIDHWNDHSASTYTADLSLSAGHHLVVVEYYENEGLAVAKFSLGPAAPVIQNWRGEYFSNRYLNGSPTLVRDDQTIAFNWGAGAPATGLPSDNFSVRWTRTLNFSPGSYRFSATTDDGVRLWVNGHLLIDRWHDQAASTYSGVLYVSGSVPIKMEYYENGGLAEAHLAWAIDGGQPPPPPPPPPPPGAVVVDDLDGGFVRGGSKSGWRSAAEGYGGHLTWTQNNDVVRSNYNWARWYPYLQQGTYEVFVHIPARYSTTTQARYWISHRDGYTLRVINQSALSGRWVSLGTYRFQGGRGDYVSLADVTFEPYLSRLIAFDAVRWEKR
jgi:hypothetical protein